MRLHHSTHTRLRSGGLTYLREGIVPRLPTAVLSTGLMIIAALAIPCGLVLDTVTRGRREMKLLAYLSQAPVNKG